jgi:hypothetical protein
MGCWNTGGKAHRGVAITFIVVLLLTGCATQTHLLLESGALGLSRRVELTAVPFHAQERFQCGPAALAMALNASGIPIAPDALVPQVYVPRREGSLQPEMLAAARRNGAIGATIPSRLDALLAELSAGHPVIVLQNLSLPLAPLWHYAVAIGYDLDDEQIILRSGTTEYLTMAISTFEHTWKRSGYWGMVVLAPGSLPVSMDEEAIVAALVDYEKSTDAARARKAYETGLRRWPQNFTLQMGLGNSAFALKDLKESEAAFRAASEVRPDDASALNNLANVFAEMGDLERAAVTAGKAVSLGGPWHDAANATLQTIRALQRRQ